MQPVEIPEPVLGPQIEWMLLSHQVDRVELIEALVRDHYLSIYWQVLSQTHDARFANQSARLTMVHAVERAHTYRIGQGVDHWISALGNEVQRRSLRRQKIQKFFQNTAPAARSNGRNPPTRNISPGPSGLDEAQVQFIAGAVAAELRAIQARRKLLKGLLWIAFAGAALTLLVVLNLSDGAMSPVSGFSPTTTQGPFSNQVTHSSIRSTPPATVIPMADVEPLHPGSSSGEIIQRVQASSRMWNSLWADGLIIDYGPEGYIGPAIVHREQLWLEPPARSRVLFGSITEGRIEKLWVDSIGQTVKEAVDDLGWKHYTGGGLIEYTSFRPLLRPAFAYFQEGRIVVLGTEIVAGHNTLVVDYFLRSGRHEGRYSVDVRTGLALRLRRYTDNSLEWVREEFIITKIDYNYGAEMAATLFEPSHQQPIAYASGPEGFPEIAEARNIIEVPAGMSERSPLPRIAPPADLDLAFHELTFQFTEITRLDSPADFADIFAGHYYLGSAVLNDPWRMQCSRSPDGETLAFYAEAPSYDEDHLPLRWIELQDLREVHSPMPGLIPTSNLAFSPDGRRLAVAGCQEDSQQECGLYILDLDDHTTERLIDLQGASSLVWNPNGQQIAFLGGGEGDPEWRIYVVDAQTGEAAYKGRVSWEASSFRATSDAPINDWQVRFPVFPRGLSDCTAAPQTSP